MKVTFQSHIGAIRIPSPYANQSYQAHFNPTLVQLEYAVFRLAVAFSSNFNPTLVQLELSALEDKRNALDLHFNPTLVQLEELEARERIAAAFISIPHWCN